MARGIFPTMPPSEIVGYLSNWDINISHEQLLRPTPEFVESVYYACLEHVTSISSHSIKGPVHTALATLDDSEQDLYSLALAHNILLHHLTRFADAARIGDFNARDIATPTSERTRYILAAFINLMRFTQQRAPFVQSLREKSDAFMQERDRVTNQLDQCRSKIDAMKAKQAADEPRCEELRTENAALTAKLVATKEVQKEIAGSCEKLKIQKNDLLQRKEGLHNEISIVSDNITRTRSRIVQSPERIKRTISVMGDTAIEDKRTVGMLEAKGRDLHAKIGVLLGIEKDVRGCVEQLQNIEREVGMLESSEKDLTDLKDHLDEKKIERSELNLRQERVHKQLSNAHDKLDRAQRHAEEKRLASQKTIERLQKEYDEMATDRKENDKEVEELRREAEQVETKMAEHLKRSEGELNQLLAEYWKVRHELDVYMETIGNKLGIQVHTD